MISREAKRRKVMDWTKQVIEPIAVKFFYYGPAFQGFATSHSMTHDYFLDDSGSSVEDYMFRALVRTNMVPSTNRHVISYSRCGRTDKGVSAMGQVVSLRVRQMQDLSLFVKSMNKSLPESIRIYQAQRASETFHARFICKSRTYLYLFGAPENGSLDVCEMNSAAARFVGSQVNFQLLCRPSRSRASSGSAGSGPGLVAPNAEFDETAAAEDEESCGSFLRDVYESRIIKLSGLHVPQFPIYAFHIRGSSFLYHQVRCMMAVLLQVGKGSVSVVQVEQLLQGHDSCNVRTMGLAAAENLVLWDCSYDTQDSLLQPTALPAHEPVTTASNPQKLPHDIPPISASKLVQDAADSLEAKSRQLALESALFHTCATAMANSGMTGSLLLGTASPPKSF
nr:tRNA pseudouridine synthase [Andalucia godoyi]|eukprot:ANDGO_00289.mRNA.1 Putative tRNA pseudouridine synthase C25B8.05